MKRLFTIPLIIIALSSCSVMGKINWDPVQLAQAANSALTAASITDAQVAALSAQTIAQLDAQNTIENGAYLSRLKRVMAGIDEVEGLKLNYKVYKTQEVNAFACGDGSIRVYSGLMDVMDDDELLAIIGHEIGHVVHKDSKNAMKSAYLAQAARGVVSATGGTVASLSKSVLGDIGESFISSQFSQKQEFSADRYGFEFSSSHGHDPYSMYNALNRLLELSGSSASSSLVQHLFASHPDTEQRAARVKEMADALKK